MSYKSPPISSVPADRRYRPAEPAHARKVISATGQRSASNVAVGAYRRARPLVLRPYPRGMRAPVRRYPTPALAQHRRQPMQQTAVGYIRKGHPASDDGGASFPHNTDGRGLVPRPPFRLSWSMPLRSGRKIDERRGFTGLSLPRRSDHRTFMRFSAATLISPLWPESWPA